MISQIMNSLRLWNNIYDTCITKFVSPSSAGDFACSAGELEIESESWSVQPKAGDLASLTILKLNLTIEELDQVLSLF